MIIIIIIVIVIVTVLVTVLVLVMVIVVIVVVVTVIFSVSSAYRQRFVSVSSAYRHHCHHQTALDHQLFRRRTAHLCIYWDGNKSNPNISSIDFPVLDFDNPNILEGATPES